MDSNADSRSNLKLLIESNAEIKDRTKKKKSLTITWARTNEDLKVTEDNVGDRIPEEGWGVKYTPVLIINKPHVLCTELEPGAVEDT